MTRAVLSIGSNLGDRLTNLRIAVTGLADVLGAASPVYETKPWGVADQPDFLNAVLIVADPDTDEWGWLRHAQRLEHRAGRVRTRCWGPRTLDVDVVTVDGVTSDHPDLTLPHPGTPDRATVLIPWLDVEPDAVLPGHGPVRDLLGRLDTAGVVRRDDLDLVSRAGNSLPQSGVPGGAQHGGGGSATGVLYLGRRQRSGAPPGRRNEVPDFRRGPLT